MNKKILHTVIDQRAREFPGRIAIETAEDKITYSQLKECSDLVRDLLVLRGLEKGERVGVFMESSIEYVCTMIGISKAGGVFMPLNPAHPVSRLQYIVELATPTFIIAGKQQHASIRELLFASSNTKTEGIVCEFSYDPAICTIQRTGHASEILRPGTITGMGKDRGVAEHDSSYIIYTSGSTGNPKLIEGVHKGLAHFINWQLTEFSIDHTVRVSQLAPVSFDVSFRDIFLPLAVGGTLCIPRKEDVADIRKLVQWVEKSKVSLMHIVPSVFRLFTKELENAVTERPARGLKNIFLAGEPLYYKDVSNWTKVAGYECQLVNLYGPSETTLAKLFHRIDPRSNGEEGSIAPLGIPISHTMVAIMNGNRLCENGELGEIVIKTPFRSKGYFNDPAMTKEKFVQNPLHNEYEDIVYRTGDMGKKQENGMILFFGRADGQVKIRGNRVELQEIEKVIGRYPLVEQVLVIPHTTASHDIQLICYYTAGGNVSKEDIATYTRKLLPDYMHPSYIIRLQTFPLNLNGKINRAALPKPDDLLYETGNYKEPSTGNEKLLHGIWSEILGLKKVGILHNFFELGGHSLSATRIVSALYRTAGIEISLKEFLDNATIEKLAKLIEEKVARPYERIPTAPLKEYYSLSLPQRSLWLANQLEGPRDAYVIGGIYQLDSVINKEALEKSFNELVQRHEILRTIFLMVNGEPVQKILEPGTVSFVMEYVDDTANQDQSVSQPDVYFDLAQWPLFKAILIKKSAEKYFLVFLAHHIVTDAWANKILTRELLALYQSYKENTKIRLPVPSIQYRDYVCWQQLQYERRQAINKDYWLKELEGIPAGIHLPVDYSPELIKTNRAATAKFSFSTKETATISQYLRKNKISLFMFFVTLLDVLLYRYSGQKDIAIGTPVLGRDHPDLENLPGLFLNNLVIRNSVNLQENVGDYLQRVKYTIEEAYAHQDYPFYQLAEDMQLERAPHQNPFYNVLVVMNNKGLNTTDEDNEALKNIFGLSDYQFEHSYSKLDLSFFVNDDDPVSFRIEYKEELFAPSTIESLGNNLKLLVNPILDGEELTIAGLLQKTFKQEEEKMYLEGVDMIEEDF